MLLLRAVIVAIPGAAVVAGLYGLYGLTGASLNDVGAAFGGAMILFTIWAYIYARRRMLGGR